MNIDEQFFKQNKSKHPYAEKVDSYYNDKDQLYTIQLEEVMMFEESISIPRIESYASFFKEIKEGSGSEHVRFRYSARLNYTIQYHLEDNIFIFKKPAKLKSSTLNDVVECHNQNMHKDELYEFLRSQEDAFMADQNQNQIQRFINHQNNFNINES